MNMLEKIIAEIEYRRQDLVYKLIGHKEDSEYIRLKAMHDAYVDMFAFINTFPDEPVSEDERIRDVIFNCMYYCSDRDFITKEERNDAVAYLEKQKENPKSADSIPSDCVSDVKCENRCQKTADFIPEGPKGPSEHPDPPGRGLSDFIQDSLDAIERIYNLDGKDWDVVCNLKNILLSMLVITTSLGYEDLHGKTAKLLDQIIE